MVLLIKYFNCHSNKTLISDNNESKKLLLVCVIVIICVLVGAVAVTSNQQKETQITVISSSSLYNGESVTVKLTTLNGTPIANQSVNITLVSANGARNTLNLVTNSEGIATFQLNGVNPGTYTLESVFGGGNGYKQSNNTTTLEVKEKVEATQQSSSSNSDSHSDWVCEGDTWYSKELSNGHYALYDKSTGRMIGTGDMPDRHGYHDSNYIKEQSSSVKYRKNGEYYTG